MSGFLAAWYRAAKILTNTLRSLIVSLIAASHPGKQSHSTYQFAWILTRGNESISHGFLMRQRGSLLQLRRNATLIQQEGPTMRTRAIKVTPEDYILSVLTPQERLDAAFRVAEAAFTSATLTMKDVENAVKTLRRKADATKK